MWVQLWCFSSFYVLWLRNSQFSSATYLESTTHSLVYLKKKDKKKVKWHEDFGADFGKESEPEYSGTDSQTLFPSGLDRNVKSMFCSWQQQQQQQPAAVQVQAEQVNSKSQECAERVHVSFSSVYLSRSVLAVPSFSCYQRLEHWIQSELKSLLKNKKIKVVL